jgi:hypothetical protein
MTTKPVEPVAPINAEDVPMWIELICRDFWFSECRPIINAIGEISVQEAMTAIERKFDARIRTAGKS